MYELKLLGTIDLRAPDGRRVGSVLSQPKRLALLAMLAMEAPRRLCRDELIGRFWPETSDDRARQALRQSLYYLRRSLGPGVIEGKGEEGIGIGEGRLHCDARSLLDAAEAGRFEEIVDGYAGELLPAFHLDDAPAAFEHWLESTRRQLHDRAVDAAWRLAERESEAGNHTKAVAAAREAWALDAEDERALQRLLRTLVAAGDLLGARAAYDEFEATLAEQSRTPVPETTEIVAEAERAAAAAHEQKAVAGHEPNATPAAEAPPEPGWGEAAAGSDPGWGEAAAEKEPRQRRVLAALNRWSPVAAIVVVLLVISAAFLPTVNAEHEPARPYAANEGPQLYLESVRDLTGEDRSVRAEALTTELAARLIETGAYSVALGERDGRAVGMVLRPTLQRDGDEVALSVLLIDAGSDAVLGRVALTTTDAAEASPGALAARMAPRLRQRIGELVAWRGLAAQRIRPEALDLVRTAADELKTARRLRQDGAREAAAMGYVAVDSLLLRATGLAPEWVEPRARRAELALERVWLHLVPPHDDPALAHSEILEGLERAEEAIAVEEGARSLDVRGILHYWASLTATDRDRKLRFQQRAERDLERAVRLDADRSRAWNVLSALAERRGDHALAYQRARKAYATDHAMEASSDILARLFTNALEVGDEPGAREWCREAHHQRPDHWLGPYCELSRLAWAGPWSAESGEALLAQAREVLPPGPGGAMIGDRFALLHAVVLARAGEDTAARRILAAVDITGRDLQLLELGAWARAALGDTERARELLSRAEELHPDRAAQVLASRRFESLSPYAVVRSDD